MKVQVHSSSKPPLEYNQGQTPQRNQIVYDLLNQIAVTEILRSIKLFLEGKASKEIPESSLLRVPRKDFSKQLGLTSCRVHINTIKWRRYSRFFVVENTISNLSKVTRIKFLRGDRLFCFISINKFSKFCNN